MTVSALAFIGLALVRSPTLIIPPTEPAGAVTAYVVDYGYHSRLILPEIDSGLMQYSYGDWRYFALNQQNFSNAVAALLVPTQGTLVSPTLSGALESVLATLVPQAAVNSKKPPSRNGVILFIFLFINLIY